MPSFKKYLKKAAKKYAKKAIAKMPGRKRMTRPRRKAVVKRYRAAAGAITNSLWAYGRSRVPKQVLTLRRAGAPDTWHQNYSDTIEVPTGFQKFQSFGSLLRSQITSINGIVGNQSALNRCLIESAQTELTFTNVTNAAVEVELYDIVPKRDLPNTWSVQLSNGLYAGNTSPESAITLGTQAAGGYLPGSATDPSTFIGSSPFDSRIFKDNFRVVQRSHIMLASGASHRHQAQMKINRVAEQSVTGNISLSYVKGFSYLTLMCIRGTAVGLEGQDPGVLTSTTNRSTLNVVTSLRVKYTYVTDNNYSAVYYDQLPHDVNTLVRNIGNGAVESVNP